MQGILYFSPILTRNGLHRQLFMKTHYLCRNDPPAVLKLLHAYVLDGFRDFIAHSTGIGTRPKIKFTRLLKYSLYFYYSPRSQHHTNPKL